MFVVVVDWAVAAKDRSQFSALLAQQAQNSLREEPDCHTFDVCEDPEKPGHFLLYEVYTDAQAFETHLSSAHFAAFAPQADALTLSKTVRTYARL